MKTGCWTNRCSNTRQEQETLPTVMTTLPKVLAPENPEPHVNLSASEVEAVGMDASS